MFKSPYARIAGEEKPVAKKAPAPKADSHEDSDGVAKSMTVNVHHDGHYSTAEGDEAHDHDNLESLKDAFSKFVDEEEHEGEEPAMKAPVKKSAGGSDLF